MLYCVICVFCCGLCCLYCFSVVCCIFFLRCVVVGPVLLYLHVLFFSFCWAIVSVKPRLFPEFDRHLAERAPAAYKRCSERPLFVLLFV